MARRLVCSTSPYSAQHRSIRGGGSPKSFALRAHPARENCARLRDPSSAPLPCPLCRLGGLAQEGARDPAADAVAHQVYLPLAARLGDVRLGVLTSDASARDALSWRAWLPRRARRFPAAESACQICASKKQRNAFVRLDPDGRAVPSVPSRISIRLCRRALRARVLHRGVQGLVVELQHHPWLELALPVRLEACWLANGRAPSSQSLPLSAGAAH